MTCDYIQLAQPCVQALTPYQPGKPIEELERELGLTSIVKLASNENPLGPSEAVMEALQAAIPELSRYPDGSAFYLRDALVSHLSLESVGLNASSLTFGNGSNDVLELIARAYLSPNASAMYSEHAFAVYPIVTQAIGARAIVVPAKDYAHDLDAMANALEEDTRVVFLANPNNPTGTRFISAEFESFMARVPESTLVVLDEAYCEYVDSDDYPDGVQLLSRYSNLIVSRTFSKAYGLAALRVGYAISNSAIADVLNRVRQPFNVNSLALTAAATALDDQAYLQKGIALNNAGMVQYEAAFKQLGLSWIPSSGNFISVRVGDAANIYDALLRLGVIVRPVANYGMPNHLRISIGLEEENQRCIEALTQLRSELDCSA